MARLSFLLRSLLQACLPAALMVGVAHAQGIAAQTIQFLPISDRPVSSAPFQVVAVASSNLPVTLTVQGLATLDTRRLLTLNAPGVITVTAVQPGNTQYAPVTAKLSFNVTPSPTSIIPLPTTSIVYGKPLSAVVINATASASPVFDPSADASTMTSQLGSSQIAPGTPIPYPQASLVFRYEGAQMAVTTDPNGHGGFVPTNGEVYRVAFSCDCQQFEYVVQSRQSSYHLWVDGAYQSLDATVPDDHFPQTNYVLVQFPDKRARQIKVSFDYAAPFFGVVTANGDTVSAPQVPVGERVIVFGDSWTSPTILQAALPPAQDGITGSGYPEVLGEYFNWDYWDSGVGGEGFSAAGTDVQHRTFPQRVLDDVCPYSPAAIVLLGGVNDGGATEATEQANITETLQNLQSCLPGVPVYMYGPQFIDQNIDAAFAAAESGFSSVHYTNMGQQNWFYGSTTSAGIGNEYLYFNGHPTPLGHNYLAEKIAIDLITAFPTLLPAPYPLLAPVPVAGVFSYLSPNTLLPAGSNTVTGDFTPADAVTYATASFQETVVVTKASTTTGLTQQTTSGVPTITVSVQPQIAGVPSGPVVVSEQGSTLATLVLNAGSATYNAASLANGNHTLSFSYAGDGNFDGSAGSILVAVAAVAPDFSVAGSPAALTIKAGDQGSVSLVIMPVGNLTAALNLTCTGLPVGAACALTGGSAVSIAGLPVTAQVTIQTAASTAMGATPAGLEGASPRGSNAIQALGGRWGEGVGLCGVFGAGLLTLAGKRRRWGASLYLIFMISIISMVAAMLAGMAGCGSSNKPANSAQPVAPVTYTVRMQLSDSANAGITHAATIMLTVD